MYLRKIILIAGMLLGMGSVGNAQQSADAANIRGEWKVIKVAMQLFAQQGDRLLEEKTVTAPEAIKGINGFVPLHMDFRDRDCVTKHRNGVEICRYALEYNNVLLYQRGEVGEQPDDELRNAMRFEYRMLQPDTLMIDMPTSYFKDSKRNMAVKMVYSCFYQRVNQ